jgi:lipoyl(octanoyl) transferase
VPLISQAQDSVISVAPISILRLGLVEYIQALSMQRSIHSEVVAGDRQNSLLLLEHPSVFTAGKRTLEIEKPQDGTPVVDVDRGGKITWHGPGQLVGYPIVKLANPTELVGFVREIESGLIAVCGEIGLETSRVAGRSGVWVRDSKGDRKIAAIGIRVASGVSMHGFAINVNPDLSHFNRIVACGINDASVSSLALELNRSITVDEVVPLVEKHLSEVLMKVSA